MSSDKSPARLSVAKFVRRRAGALLAVLGLMALATALGLANPWLVQQLVDRVLIGKRPELLWMFAALFAGMALSRFALEYAQSQLYAAFAARVLIDLQREFLERVERLSPRFFASTRLGDLAQHFHGDLGQVQQFATGALPGLATSVLTLCGALAWGLAYDPALFAVACAPLPFAVLAARRYRKPVEEGSRRLRELGGEVNTSVFETLSGMRTVRSFGRERREVRRFVGRAHEALRAALGFQRTTTMASGLPRLCLVASTTIVYVLGGARVIRGEMQIGELVAQSMYLTMLFGPLLALSDFYLRSVQARVSLERVRKLAEAQPDVEEDPRAPRPKPLEGSIEFVGVHFGYAPSREVLSGASFRIEAGERVALVGPSGAGKSTLVDLLFRFLDPARGRVEIDGQDLRAVRMRDLRAGMAVVSQDVYLFHDTLLENVRYGRPGASDVDVRGAARLAGIGESGSELALETVVGERGARLSGGQRQRVAIARALLRRPRILVLDEATSGLDRDADRDLRAMLRRELPAATLLIVTHREDWIEPVDRVLRLDSGRVVEQARERRAAGAGM
jgi:ATP-binding cassette subfamily B protein